MEFRKEKEGERGDQGEGQEKHECAFKAALLRTLCLLLRQPTRDRYERRMQQKAKHMVLSQRKTRI